MGDSLDLGRRAYGLIRRDTTLGVHQVRRKDGVDER